MFELRTDHPITTADGIATEKDIQRLHDALPGNATGKGVTVAVMDSGIDKSHPVFEHTYVEQHDFTGYGNGDAIGHGTATAGLIAQLAPDVEIIALRIFGDSGTTGLTPIRKAYEWCYNNADRIDICNMSWGARRNVSTINQLHQKLIDNGVRDVVAAGNTGSTSGSPATAMDAYSAGAVDENGHLTRFSSYNPERDNPDVCGLGKNVRLPRADGTSMGSPIDEHWTKASGTSFSAPIVSALTAQYMELGGTKPKVDFQFTARNIPETPEDGEGIADYDDAIKQIGKDTPKSPPETPDGPESPLMELIELILQWLKRWLNG